MLLASPKLTISHAQGGIIIADLVDHTISALIALRHAIGIDLISTSMYTVCIFPRLRVAQLWSFKLDIHTFIFLSLHLPAG